MRICSGAYLYDFPSQGVDLKSKIYSFKEVRAIESNLVVSFDEADARVSEDDIIVDKEGDYVYSVERMGNREDALITDQCEMAQSEVCGAINPVLNHCPSKRATRKLAGAFTLDKSLVSG